MEPSMSGTGGITATQAIALPSGYSMSVNTPTEQRGLGALELRAPDGRVCLTVFLGPNGPEVRIEAAELSIATRGKMDLEAESMSLTARRDFSLRAGGDISIETPGHLSTSGFSQSLTSTHGDLHLDANDDVRVDGERIRLNAPDAPPLRKREPEDDEP